MSKQTVIQALFNATDARERCRANGNQEWCERWRAFVQRIESDLLPRGSGIDNGTHVQAHSRKGGEALYLSCDFHHMNETGYYDGWTSHKVIVRPSFSGLDISIGGSNRNDVKEYLQQTFYAALSAELPEGWAA